MRKHIRLPAFVLALLLILPLCTFLSLGSFAGELTMHYEPDAATASLPGYCAGTITITPGSDSRKTGWYALYLASDSEVLSGYEPVAQEQITGKKVTITLPYGMYLPAKATSLVLFEGASKTPSDRSLEKASAIVKLKKEALSLKDAQFTFASVSDVHLNYDDHGYGASTKWTAALDFFKSKKMEMVVISGDLTESGGKTDYDRYTAAIKASEYPADQIYSAQGNHDVPNTNLFLTATAQADQVHPFPGSAYLHVLKKGEENEKDNLFIFMAQELSSTSASASTDNFSSTQLDWLEDLLIRYAGTNTNIFIIEHAMMRNFGPGDRINGAYGEPIVLDERFDGNMRFKELLTEYKEVIMMSGHTHLSFYELLNYSDEQGTAARMIHNSSISQPRSYTSSGTISYNSEGRTNARSGSEGYLVYVYEDHILYLGYSLTTKRIIPRACYLLDSYSEERADVVDISLKRAPDKTVYTVGEWFNGAGMEIEATFADGSKKVVSGWGVSNVGKLSADDRFVEIYYGTLDKTVKVEISVTSKDSMPAFKGKGTLAEPYLIENSEDFKRLTDLFNDSKDAASIYGTGLYFRQTADIDMTDVAGYKGTPANGDDKRYFGGNYDGGGYTLTVNIKSSGQTSIFPYVYGAIYNVVLRGSIESSTSAQPIRTLQKGSVLANSDIALTLFSSAGNCICYTNYATVYNVYVHGKGDDIFKGVSGGTAIKVYSNCQKDNGSALTDSHTTATSDVAQVAKALGDLTTADDTAGIKALAGALGDFEGAMLAKISHQDGALVFDHPEGYVPDGKEETKKFELQPLTWGLVKREYGDKSGSLLLLKVSGHSDEHIGAPCFDKAHQYTLTVDGKSAQVTPAEMVGRLAIGFNLADYTEFEGISSGKSYEVGLKIQKADGTLLFEGSTTVSSGKTGYTGTAGLTYVEPAPEPSPSKEESVPTVSEEPPASGKQEPSAPTSKGEENEQDDENAFSPLFLIPIAVAVVIAIGGAVFAVMKKKKA